MYEPILTIKKILSGDYYFFNNIRRVVARYKGKYYGFDKDEITGLETETVPIKFSDDSTEVYICRFELK